MSHRHLECFRQNKQEVQSSRVGVLWADPGAMGRSLWPEWRERRVVREKVQEASEKIFFSGLFRVNIARHGGHTSWVSKMFSSNIFSSRPIEQGGQRDHPLFPHRLFDCSFF